MSDFNKPRLYPFRDYASVRKPLLDGKPDDLEVYRVLYLTKCVELARLQRSYELLEERNNALVRSQDEGTRKPRHGRFGAPWGKGVLAALASLLP